MTRFDSNLGSPFPRRRESIRCDDAFERTNYGIIHVRSDGERGTNEVYRFAVPANGDIAFAPRPVSVSAPKAV
ncbi:hypothetical protein [Sphingomonas sp.]|uniref:hypothetical protein n=1 Tax=Sphingomonas sp. TaxID=28214 RepID=UPI0031D0AC6C